MHGPVVLISCGIIYPASADQLFEQLNVARTRRNVCQGLILERGNRAFPKLHFSRMLAIKQPQYGSVGVFGSVCSKKHALHQCPVDSTHAVLVWNDAAM